MIAVRRLCWAILGGWFASVGWVLLLFTSVIFSAAFSKLADPTLAQVVLVALLVLFPIGNLAGLIAFLVRCRHCKRGMFADDSYVVMCAQMERLLSVPHYKAGPPFVFSLRRRAILTVAQTGVAVCQWCGRDNDFS